MVLSLPHCPFPRCGLSCVVRRGAGAGRPPAACPSFFVRATPLLLSPRRFFAHVAAFVWFCLRGQNFVDVERDLETQIVNSTKPPPPNQFTYLTHGASS